MSDNSEPQFFKGSIDMFKCITVDSEKEYIEEDKLEKTLEESVKYWKSCKIKAIWFKVHLHHSHWIPLLAKNEFVFHHAKPEYVKMVRWISPGKCNIPCYAHTNVGVGAFVLNDKNEILAVKEKVYKVPHWKLPGGYVEEGEDLHEAAIREVKEETGILTEFVSVITFRHVHGYNFGCSDLYFVVHLKPVTSEITMCQQEITDCQWMKLDEFVNHEHVLDLNKYYASRFVLSLKEKSKIKHEQRPGYFKGVLDIYYVENSNS